MIKTRDYKVDRVILMPIAFLFTLVGLDMLLFTGYDFINTKNFEFFPTTINLLILLLAVVLWILKNKQNGEAFWYVAVISCLLPFSFRLYNVFYVNSSVNLLPEILFALSSFGFVLLIFLLFIFRKSILTKTFLKVDILTFLGTYFLFVGIVILIVNRTVDMSAILRIAVGLGLLARERFFGLFGSLVLAIMPFLMSTSILGTTTEQSVLSSVFIILRISFFALGIFILLMIIKKDCFKFNILSKLGSGSGTYGYQTKKCSRCGKQVSLSSRAGQYCPHCGARWSTETKLP
jgi:hypothetical protein